MGANIIVAKTKPTNSYSQKMFLNIDSQEDRNSYPLISVLLTDGGSYDTLKVLRCLGQIPKITSHVISRQHWPITRFSRYCKKSYYNEDQKDTNQLDSIKRLVLEQKIDVLLPVTMKDTEFMSRNHKTLSEFVAIPPIPETRILKTAQDKWAFHCFADRHKLPVPPTILVADGNKIIADSRKLDSIEYPALIKPTTEKGGQGIAKIGSSSDFFSLVEQKKILNENQKYIIQRYIPGIDFCLGVLCDSGKIIAYTLQRNLNSSEKCFGYQKVMDFVNDDRIIQIGEKIVSIMSWDGIAFIDFRVDERDNSIKILEVNPRLGRALLGSLAAGVNFPFIMCLTALGINYSVAQLENTRYAHPSAFISTKISNLFSKQKPLRLKWCESGWSFHVSDPLPDLVDIINRIKKSRQVSNARQKKL